MARPAIAVALPSSEATPVAAELRAAGFTVATVTHADELEALLATRRDVAVAILDGETDLDQSLEYYSLLRDNGHAIPALMVVSERTLGRLDPSGGGVEDEYFTRRLHKRPLGAPWSEVDWEANPDWPWESAAHDSPDQLLTFWLDAVNRSRESVTEALSADGVGQLARFTFPDGQAPSLRRILVDLIEEYARHTGHADLIRESIDGRVGEDPPGGAVEYPGPVESARS